MKIFSPYKVCLLIFFLFLFLKFSYSEDNMILTAENIIYDNANKKVIAEQNVEVKYKDIHLITQHLIYDIENNIIYIDTNTIFTYQGDEVYLKKLSYDLDKEIIKIYDFYVYYSPYYSYSKECVFQEKKFYLTQAKVTHCSLKYPHYYLSSKKVVIYPDDKILIYNPKLIIRNIPIFWLPYYEVSLKPKKDYLTIEPSYESDRGVATRIKYGRRILKDLELIFNCNNYSTESIGLSTELRYSTDFYNGIFYTHYISEFKNKNNRWNIRINNLHKLPYRFSFRNNLEFVSDESLYYYYNKENWFLLKREINSSASLSWDSQKMSSRISYLRRDAYSDEDKKFKNSNIQIPFEFTIYPFDITKLKISDNFKVINTLIEATTFYKLTSENNFSITFPIKFYFLSFTPSINIVSNYLYHSLSGIFYNIYGFLIPLRINISKIGVVDFSYSYKIRSKDNNFEIFYTTSAFSNSLQVRLDLFYKRSFFRCYSIYDFLKNRSVWYHNFSPVVSNVGVSYKFFDFSLHTEYNLQNNVLQNFQFSLGAILVNNKFSIGYGKNYYQPDTHYFSTHLDIYIPNNLQFKLKALTNINKGRYEFPNARFEFYKDLHCWEAMVFCDVRKSLSLENKAEYVYEVGGNIGLKFKPYVGTGGKVSEIDKRYFPWRE